MLYYFFKISNKCSLAIILKKKTVDHHFTNVLLILIIYNKVGTGGNLFKSSFKS